MKNQMPKKLYVSEKTEYPFTKKIELKCTMLYTTNKTYSSKFTHNLVVEYLLA